MYILYVLLFYFNTLNKLKDQGSQNIQYVTISDCYEDWRRLCHVYFKEYSETIYSVN